MGGAIRVVRGDYHFTGFIKMRGEDIVLYGDGHTEMIYLQRSYKLTNESVSGIKSG